MTEDQKKDDADWKALIVNEALKLQEKAIAQFNYAQTLIDNIDKLYGR